MTAAHEGRGALMAEAVFLSVTDKSEPEVRFDGNNLIVAPHQGSRPEATDASNSGKHWASAMRFLEVNRDAILDWRAKRCPKSSCWQEGRTTGRAPWRMP